MKVNNYIRAGESVSPGHPDKLCDQISDTLLDAHLTLNPHAHVAIETLVTTGQVVLAGEVKGSFLPKDQIDNIVRDVIIDVGYVDENFEADTVTIQSFIHNQSPDIAQGINGGVGAGDQGMMFGYASNETSHLMPAPSYYSSLLMQNLHALRIKGLDQGILRPDAKAQVTVQYIDEVPVGVSSVVVSTQHSPEASHKDLVDLVTPLIHTTLPHAWISDSTSILINPAGRFVIGGPVGDTGLTGRKIIVDTYGGAAPHGGGAFSGKDPTKVDRSAAYMARFIAKNVVAAGMSARCTVEISYAIGRAEPTSLYINTHGTGTLPDDKITDWANKHFDITPKGIREQLNLNRPIYRPTATFGHFGRDYDVESGYFTWERILDDISN